MTSTAGRLSEDQFPTDIASILDRNDRIDLIRYAQTRNYYTVPQRGFRHIFPAVWSRPSTCSPGRANAASTRGG
ncbi:MAG: hypothetical protein KF762_05960 [Acidobacteria bacterium]|nr:hypothetical protein [Acidobacteriota bacterium]